MSVTDKQQYLLKRSLRMKLFLACWLFIFSLCGLNQALAQNAYSESSADRLLVKANELMEQGNYGAARNAYQNFLKNAPLIDSRRGEAAYGEASAALNLGNKDAEAVTLTFVDNYKTHPRANVAKLQLAQYFYQSQKYSKAITYFSEVDFVKLTTEQQMQGKFQYGYSYFSERKLTDALLYFNQVKFSEHAYTAAANYYAGFIAFSEEKYDAALTDLKKAETNEAYKTIVPYLIASVYYRLGQYDELLRYAEKLGDNEAIKNLRELHLLVAEAYYAKGEYVKAAAQYNQSLTDKSIGDPAIWYRAGICNDKAGNEKEAIRLLELSANTTEEISFAASHQLGIVYLKTGEKAYAINAFDRARKASDKALAEQAQFNFAKVLYDQEQADRAIVEFEFYLKAFPQGDFENETKELLAQAYVNGNNYNKAIEYIQGLPRKSAAIEQAYQKATFLKGSEYFNKNEYDEAITHFNKSLAYPRDEKYVQRAAFWNGEALSIQKKYAEAEPFYQLSIKNGAADLMMLQQALYGLGYVQYNQKEHARALNSFRDFINKSTKQTPNYADGLLRLADCHFIARSFEEALSFYNRYKEANGNDMDYAYLQAGLIYGMQRNYEASSTQFGLLIRNYPASSYLAEALYQKAQFDIEQGAYQKAIDALSQLIKSEPTSAYVPYAYARRGASYFNLKNYSNTVEDYTKLISLYPTHAMAQEVLLPLQEALDLTGRSAEFDQYLASVKKASPDSKGLEKLEFETAKKLYFNEQYDKAIIALQGFNNTYTQSVLKTEANYYVAESYYRLRDWDKAYPVYTELKQYTTFQFAARVAARLADVAFKLGRYEEAVPHYHYFERFAVTKKDLYAALSGIMESFYLLGQYDSSDHYARQIIERAAINAGAENKASLYLGKSAMAKGDYDAAEDEFLNTLNAARDEFGAEAKYLLGTIFYMRKDYKQSIETLMSLNNDFKAYDIWVGKSFLLLADNFMAKEDIFQAKATLQSLVDNFPIEAIKMEAANKLKEIEKQEAAGVAPDSVKTDN